MGQGRTKQEPPSALRELAANLRQLPGNLRRSYQRRRRDKCYLC